jgi:hypothetical protein
MRDERTERRKIEYEDRLEKKKKKNKKYKWKICTKHKRGRT